MTVPLALTSDSKIDPCTLKNILFIKEKIEGITNGRMVAQRRYISSLPPFVSG